MTTEFMQVTLSPQSAGARCGEKVLLSTNTNMEGITLHLTGNNKQGVIQRSERKIDAQGIRKVKLACEGLGSGKQLGILAGL